MSDAADNKAMIQTILEAYGSGDLGPLIAALDDDVVWHSHSPSEHWAFADISTGPDEVQEAFAEIGAMYELKSYVTRELAADGDVVWVWNDTSFVYRQNGAVVNLDIVNRWRFRNGKIVEFHEFFDTALALKQEGRLNNPNAR